MARPELNVEFHSGLVILLGRLIHCGGFVQLNP
jgi:hypothetical protein